MISSAFVGNHMGIGVVLRGVRVEWTLTGTVCGMRLER